MKKIFTLLSLTFLLGILNYGCRNPAYQLNVLFDGDVIKYKTTIMLVEADGAALPANLKVAVSGQDAANVYDFAGLKAITAPNGVITLGIDPKIEPTATRPLQFNVQVTADNYEPRNIPVTILPNQFSQILRAAMLKVISNTPASAVKTVEVGLTGGATTAPVSLVTPATGTVTEVTSISIPAGTSFRNAAGELLSGGTLTARAINFDAGNPAALDMFPGADLSSPNVKGPDGQVGSAFFVPAGFTDIDMFVGGQEVKTFSQDINVGIQINPDFQPVGTTEDVKVGDKLVVYSYQNSTGQWQYEKEVTVTRDASQKLAVAFATNHLTVFCVGNVVSTRNCAPSTFTFTAPWLGSSTLTTAVQLFRMDGETLLDEETVIVSDGRVVPVTGLPPFAVRYKVLNASTRNVLAEGTINSACNGGNIGITLGQPGQPVQQVTLTLVVSCPGVGPIVPPSFTLFYKPAGAPASQYKLLGEVQKGMLKTVMLTVGSSYDFRANWGNQTKTVNNKTITSLDLSTAVGEEFDFFGTNTPQYNRSLLIEACKNR
ncbi:hypothetical protein C7T94_04845 [Pedobacter yulinensis]|uniref:Uncharacterized protein n=1 Tax=Pedobacter yulinensis TaxID=2126353 RepID=A0A2T3HNR2_9SPHI|nr:hypothetical protein [Pedobacter yulinensis]PST84066.1 hypothetical protein C7T94_04845 [Pedobacter yulinensis]